MSQTINQEDTIEPFLAPFVVEFTKAIIMTLRNKNFPRPKGEVIHSDMVPKFSLEVIEASMKEKTIKPKIDYRPSIINFEIPRPIKQKPRIMLQIPLTPNIKPLVKQVTSSNPEMAWQKIEPLLKDPSVTHIECPGPGIPLMVSRLGQRQITKITLQDNEIKRILEIIAEKSHIPLLEGVFRAAADNIIIQAVVSDIIGSKFVIKKNTPYSMIEG